MQNILPNNYRALTARDLVQEGDQFVSPLSGDILTVGPSDPAIDFPPHYLELARRLDFSPPANCPRPGDMLISDWAAHHRLL